MLAAASLLAGCGGGGGDASATAIPTQVTVSGTVTFDRVPVEPGVGLDYENTRRDPARGVTVQAVSGSTVLATDTTDAEGRYALPLDADTPAVKIHARAEMLQTGAPGWDVRVVDNTQSNALYVLESEEFSTGVAAMTLDLHAASGWDGVSYAEPRSAAPFAILDVVYDAAQVVLDVAPDTLFPPLVVHWSTENKPSVDPTTGRPNFNSGDIGTSLFQPSLGIYLVGAKDSDTDEYDRHVVAHEWGHYLEHSLSRSDSIGGPHTRGDQLDLRTAFSEGFGNAFSAMATDDEVYVDVMGPDQAESFGFSIEGAAGSNPHPGWFSEQSIHELIYDLYDDVQDVEAADTLALGFGPILEVMAGPVSETPALTSIFPFISALKEAMPAEAPLIDELVAVHAIGDVVDHFGKDESNGGTPSNPSIDPGAEGVLPIYKDIVVGDPPMTVCSTNDFEGATGAVNKLGSRVFLRFTASTAGSHTFTATTREMPQGTTADPDMWLHRQGRILIPNDPEDPSVNPEDEPDPATCTVENAPGCVEHFSRVLQPGEHILEVFEWTNTTNLEEYPPIGRTCFAVQITQP